MPIAVSTASKEVKTSLKANNEWNLDTLDLEGNEGGKIPRASLGWLKRLPVTASDEELREAYERDGAVHITGVIDRETVLDCRESFFKFCSPCGVLKDGTSPREGIFCGGDPTKFTGPGVAAVNVKAEDNEYLRLGTEAGTQPFILDFTIMDVVRRIKPDWADPILFKRQLLRSNIPGSEKSSTKVHYDQIFLRAAPPTSLTAWVPIGDISPVSGGLLYLEKSVDIGLEIEDGFTKQNGDLPLEERLSAFNVNMVMAGFLSPDAAHFASAHGRRWLVSDYKAGDVVFHHPCMIHCSANNNDPEGRIRLATDLRFADKAAPHDERWANSYFRPGDGL